MKIAFTGAQSTGKTTLLNELKRDNNLALQYEFSLEDDGVRSTNLKFRDDIVDLFDHYIKEYKIPVTKLTGTVKQRLNKIKETIK